MKYLASAIIEVSSIPYVWSSTRTKISFLSLSKCTQEVLSIPKVMTFLLQLPSDNNDCEHEPNPIP